jgi:hypothetical protein
MVPHSCCIFTYTTVRNSSNRRRLQAALYVILTKVVRYKNTCLWQHLRLHQIDAHKDTRWQYDSTVRIPGEPPWQMINIILITFPEMAGISSFPVHWRSQSVMLTTHLTLSVMIKSMWTNISNAPYLAECGASAQGQFYPFYFISE